MTNNPQEAAGSILKTIRRSLTRIVSKLLDLLTADSTKTTTNMATQIIDDGASIKIVTNGVPKFVLKTNVVTVETLFNGKIKIDIGKDPLHNVYVDQATVDNPVSVNPDDLRDKIEAMLEPVSMAGTTATAANQLIQTAELQNIKTSMVNVNNALNVMNDNMVLEPKLVDETEGRVIYKGYAVPGTAGNTAVWAIQRVTNDDGNLSYHWALGTKNFDKRWDLRREYQYS